MKTVSIVDKDTLIRQLEDQFWDERENHKAHAKILFSEICALKEQRTALKEAAKRLVEYFGNDDLDNGLEEILSAFKNLL